MDDLLREFLTETAESLSVLDVELVRFEQNPEDATILGNIFRDLLCLVIPDRRGLTLCKRGRHDDRTE